MQSYVFSLPQTYVGQVQLGRASGRLALLRALCDCTAGSVNDVWMNLTPDLHL
jgi:hypothetical protein